MALVEFGSCVGFGSFRLRCLRSPSRFLVRCLSVGVSFPCVILAFLQYYSLLLVSLGYNPIVTYFWKRITNRKILECYAVAALILRIKKRVRVRLRKI